MRKLLAFLAIATMPFVGVAQSLAQAPQLSPVTAPNSPLLNTQPQLLEQLLGQNFSDNTHSVPLWGTPDGRILAMVATNNSSNYPVLPASAQSGVATQWNLLDVTNVVSSGFLMRLGDNAAAHISLGQSTILAPNYAPLCNSTGADANSLCANQAAATLAHGGELRLGTNWSATENFDLDFSYGLSWLRRNAALSSRQSGGYDALAGVGNSALPTLIIPGLQMADMQDSSIGALGRLRLNDSQTIDLGASLSRIQLSIPGAAPLTSLNQAAVSFGVEYGSFSGMLTGRVLGPTDPYSATGLANQRWSGLDLGISWRTPWHGMFSVGAQNLWSSGSVPMLNQPSTREIDPNQARVPYVQYRQDL